MWTILSIVISAALALTIAWFQSDIQQLRERFGTKRAEKRHAREVWEADQKERFLHDPVFRNIVLLHLIQDTSRINFLWIVALACYTFAGFLGVVRTFDALEPLARAFGNDLAVIGYIVFFTLAGAVCLYYFSHLAEKANKQLRLFTALLDDKTGEQKPWQSGPGEKRKES